MRCWEWRRKGAMRTSIWGRGRAAIALAALCLVSAGTALAASSSAIGPARAKITIKGGDSFKPNAYITNTYHFVSGTVVIRSGGTVTLTTQPATRTRSRLSRGPTCHGPSGKWTTARSVGRSSNRTV